MIDRDKIRELWSCAQAYMYKSFDFTSGIILMAKGLQCTQRFDVVNDAQMGIVSFLKKKKLCK